MKIKLRTSGLFASIAIITTGLIVSLSCNSNKNTDSYKGEVYSDSIYSGGAQSIPGKLQCEYYDLGGEGVAYHDSDSINSGSGQLNVANGTYLHEFRMNEAVDISYTKFLDPAVDNSPFNIVETEKDQLYVGWTNPGEWIKYTIDVETEGTYQLGLMFTSNQGGKIAFSINDVNVTEPIEIPTTYVEADTVAWRQWHHWNYIDNIAEIKLDKGTQILTIHTVEVGQMNYDFVNFKLIR